MQKTYRNCRTDWSSYQSQMKWAASQMKVLFAEYFSNRQQDESKVVRVRKTDSLKAKAESLAQKITVQKNIVQLNSEATGEVEQRNCKTKRQSRRNSKQRLNPAKEAYEKSTAETRKETPSSQKHSRMNSDKLEKEFTAKMTAKWKEQRAALADGTVKTEKSKSCPQ